MILLSNLSSITKGNRSICIAILDGIVDQAHDCFQDADLTRLPSLVQGKSQSDGKMSAHGTHVTSIIFGQPGSPVEGIAPHCKGLIIPVFPDDRLRASQLDLARGIEQAVAAGAHIINISGGQLTDFGEAEGWLENAVNLCQQNNILIVSAAGNDGCECLHVPAALSTVLAVGAMDSQGKPSDFSNWGAAYQSKGILAPGENILGAKPGGGTERLNGTSFAAPIVSGVAALLLSLQVQQGKPPDPHGIRKLLLQTAVPCDPKLPEATGRCLAGKLNISGALTLLQGETMTKNLAEASLSTNGVEASECGCGGGLTELVDTGSLATEPADVVASETASVAAPTVQPSIQPAQTAIMSNSSSNLVTASQAPSQLAELGQLVYALGTLGYDFGTEARRDSFKQLMPANEIAGTMVPANPYDARQMVDHLGSNLAEARSLIWTLNIELTPVYAIEPKGPFAREIYQVLQQLLSGQIQPEDSQDYVERVSIPGVLTGKTVKLFSGQVVPLIEPQNTRGLYGWKVNSLVSAAMQVVTDENEADEDTMRRTLGSFLNRVYYDLRNLGTTSQDRALNFSVTNAFQAASTFGQAVAEGMELDSVTVEKSPFCRMDSDCWDVKLKFFDPENNRRAKKIYRFTIDVSDLIPVTLGEVRSWSSPY
ncbi:MAG: PatA/PatG family cyanobactin maturation protease [Microcoleaceae cyanobacterium]